MGADLWELFEDGQAGDEVAAIIRLGHSSAVPRGVRVVTQFSEIITVRMKRGDVLKVSGAPEVDSMIAGDLYFGADVELEIDGLPELSAEAVMEGDERRPRDLTATGRGVVVGVVDWGFDFAHPDFLNKDGTTRILALWDQRGSKRPGSPQPFGYGIVHDREAINRALKSKDPYAALGYHPADADTGIGCHGTHVAGIAAGSGSDDRPLGIAPEADLVVVHNAPWDEAEPSKLGDSVTLLEGIDFISRTAGDRPWVINLSMGRHGEQHDGSTLIEQGLDAAIRSAPGRAVCLSAGNYYDKRIHASGQLRPTQERTLTWETVPGRPTYNQLEVWYSWQDKFEVTVRSPDGAIAARVKVGERAKFLVGGKEVGNVYHRSQEPNNLDNHVTIYLYKEAPTGAWDVTLIGADVIDGRYHAWIERDVTCPRCQSHFHADDADPRSTTGTICNGRRTIAVGAYDNHDPDKKIGRFSSVGPTRDGRLKPDLSAPGVSVLAARSAPRHPSQATSLLTRMSGTSMAAPHVTGTVALMFQVAPRRLRIEETRNLLLENTRRVGEHLEDPDRFGIGFLDIVGAVEAARKLTGSSAASFKQTNVHSKSAVPPGGPQSESVEQELLESDAERESFEGRADSEFEYEGSETEPHENTFHRIANDITGAFEGGKPGTLNLYDRGIISYGKHQATLASGTLYPILKRFTELSTGDTATKLSSYLDRVNRKDETLREDSEFIRLLKEAAKESAMVRAQDQEFTRQYWEPAKKIAAAGNIITALGHAIFYDTKVQGGLHDVLKRTEARLGGKVGDIVAGRQIGEQEALRAFVDERIERHLRISARQRKLSEALNKDALELEEAAASDPDRAEALKRQASEKRKKAKQNAANAAALEISAKKTRGPSFMALVESGDLNLYDGQERKICLKGKAGVVINSLAPGATIDETAAAETDVAADVDAESRGRCPSSHEGDAELDAEDREGAEFFPSAGNRPNPALDLVELADQVVLSEPSHRASLIHEVFDRAGKPKALASPVGGAPISAVEIFDSFVYPGQRDVRAQLEQHFEVVAFPGSQLEKELHEADVLVRRGEGATGHVSLIASAELKDFAALISEGLKPESLTPGRYVQVVETGIFPHLRSDGFARRIGDQTGRLPNDQLILRPRIGEQPGESGFSEGACPGQANEQESVIRGWGQYKDEVATLPESERAKIERLADLVVTSFAAPGCAPWGRIGVVGHADKDYHGSAFEQRVSEKRARSVATALGNAIAERWATRGLPGPWSESVRFEPAPTGAGATEPDPVNAPVVTNRQLNRRVVVTLKRQARPAGEILGWPDAPFAGATSDLGPSPHVGWNRSEAAVKDASIAAGPKGPPESSEQVRIGNERRIGSIRRIPIVGLTQGNLDPNRVPEAEEAADGRAIVLLPATLDPTEPAEVVMHLHGHNVGYRQRKLPGKHRSLRVGTVRDVDTDRIEQQIEQSGRPYIAVLPQGTTQSGFGRLTPRAYIDEVFRAVTSAGIWSSAPPIKKILLTAHSGGGEIISTMMAEPGQPRMPANLKLVALFDAINGDKTEFPNVKTWVIEQLELDLKALTAAGSSSEQKYRYLHTSMRFRAYYTDSSYRPRHERLEKAINAWFALNAGALGGTTSEFFSMLRGNYQVIPVGPVSHEVIMSEGDPDEIASVGQQFRQALALAISDHLNPIRADEAGKILITFNVGRFSVFIPEKVILSTRGEFDPTPNLSVNLFFSAGRVQSSEGNDVLTHGLRGASSQSEWVTIGVHSHNKIRDWEVRECLTSVGILGPVARMRLCGHSRGGESLRATILEKAITTLNLIDRITLLDSEDSSSPAPKSKQLVAAGVAATLIVAYEVNVRKTHTPQVTYLSIDSNCSAALGYVRLIRDAMVTQSGIDALVRNNPRILSQLNSIPLPPRGSFTAKSAPGGISIQKFCSDHRTAMAAILRNQTDSRSGLLAFINRNDLARFRGFIFDQGISAHHFFVAEIAHELFD